MARDITKDFLSDNELDFLTRREPEVITHHPIKGLPQYGLTEGTKIVVDHGRGWIDYEPDEIEVIKEYPNFILCRYKYSSGEYRHCLNKVLIVSGDIRFREVE